MRLHWETIGVMADFRRCQTTSQNTDLVFYCTNGKVSAHQMIFAGISRLFTELMQRYLVGQELIPLDLNISLPEIRREHMELVVEMVYTGQVSMAKGDYPPFREICQLLELCVPIGDYDDFVTNLSHQNDDDGHRSNEDVQDSEAPMPDESIPLKSCLDPRVFVCDQCYAMFPLKFALKRHRQVEHGETQSCALISMKSTRSPELSNPRSSTIDQDGGKSKDDVPNLKAQMPVVSIPLKTWPDRPIFVCDLCYATFLLKKALKRHKESRHGETESLASNPMDLAGSPEVSNRPTVKRVSKRRRCSTIDKSYEPTFECPDCLKRLPSRRILNHLNIHLEKELNEFITVCQSVSGLEKCKLCSYVAPSRNYMRVHIGVTHRILFELANKAQMKFLQGAGGVFARQGKSSSNPNELLTNERVKTTSEILQNEALSEVSDIKKRNSLEDNNETESPRHKASTNSRIHSNLRQSEGETELPPTKSMKRSKRSLKKRQTLKPFYATNGEDSVKCPDCQKSVIHYQAREHLASHMGKCLRKFVTKANSKLGQFKCRLCGFGRRKCGSLIRHVGLSHNLILKFANEDHKQFLFDSETIQKAMNQFNRLECPGRPSLPRRVQENQFKEPESLHLLEKEDLTQKENNETGVVVEDEDLSQREDNNGEKEKEDLTQKENNETGVVVEDEDLSQREDNNGEKDKDISKIQDNDGEIKMDNGNAIKDEDLSTMEDNYYEIEIDNAMKDEDFSEMQGNEVEIKIDDPLDVEHLSKVQGNDSEIETDIAVTNEDPIKMEEDNHDATETVVDDAADVLDYFL